MNSVDFFILILITFSILLLFTGFCFLSERIDKLEDFLNVEYCSESYYYIKEI